MLKILNCDQTYDILQKENKELWAKVEENNQFIALVRSCCSIQYQIQEFYNLLNQHFEDEKPQELKELTELIDQFKLQNQELIEKFLKVYQIKSDLK